MAKCAYVGIGGKARKVKDIFVGVNGKAREVKKGYIGVGGVARLFFEAVPPLEIIMGSTQLAKSNSKITIDNIGFVPTNGVIYSTSTTQSSLNVAWAGELGYFNTGGFASKANSISISGQSVTFFVDTNSSYYFSKYEKYSYIIWKELEV